MAWSLFTKNNSNKLEGSRDNVLVLTTLLVDYSIADILDQAADTGIKMVLYLIISAMNKNI